MADASATLPSTQQEPEPVEVSEATALAPEAYAAALDTSDAEGTAAAVAPPVRAKRVLWLGGAFILAAACVAAIIKASGADVERLKRVGSALPSISEAEKTWIKHEGMVCQHGEPRFATLAEAEAACGPSCPGIYSVACNPLLGFALCEGTGTLTPSSCGSCTFQLGCQDDKGETPGDVPGGGAPQPIDEEGQCKLAAYALIEGMCYSDAIKSTCPFPAEEVLASCEAWVDSMDEPAAHIEARRKRCKKSVDAAAAVAKGMEVKAVTAAERKTCLKCDISRCTQKPIWLRCSEHAEKERLRLLEEGRSQEKHLRGPTAGTEQRSLQRAVTGPPDGSVNHCRPMVNGQPVGVQRRIRREIKNWNAHDFAAFSAAVNTFRKMGGPEDPRVFPRTWGSFIAAHPFAHPDGPFLPWHRRMLHALETQLQQVGRNCSLTLPYWNSNQDASAPLNSIVWDARFYGGKGGSPTSLGGTRCSYKSNPNYQGYCLINGIAANWKLTPANPSAPDNACERCVHRAPRAFTITGDRGQVISFPMVIGLMMQYTNLRALSDFLSDEIHGQVHAGIAGGDMGVIPTAPRDPIFYLHHAYIDRLFNWWQAYYIGTGLPTHQWPFDNGRIMAIHNEAVGQWVGRFDPSQSCTMLPTVNPTVCIGYQNEILAP